MPEAATTFDPKALIGLNEKTAQEHAALNGFFLRVRERDGKRFMGTADFRTDRVNVQVVGGKVTGASVG